METQSRSAPSVLGSNLSRSSASFLRFLRSTSNSSLRPALCTLMATFFPLYVAGCDERLMPAQICHEMTASHQVDQILT